MQTKFSDKVKDLEASAIREIFKLLGKPGVISFAGGAPDPELFPCEELAKAAFNVLKDQGKIALQYGVTEGYAPLRDWVKNRLVSQGIIKKDDNNETIIVSGGQQGIDLAAKSLLNPGDGVVCEQPSFIGGLNCFRSYNAEIYGVRNESDGLDMEELEELLKQHKNIKIVYTIATFQNPSGITMSLEKRRKLLELADKYDFIIFEDNPYGELGFSGETVPTIKSMDKNDRVVYLGSFSKILSPGIRVGFTSCHRDLMERMIICKQVQDVHTNVVAQMIIYEYISNNSIDEHIKKLRAAYGEKCRFMCECMDKFFPKCVTHTHPDGGLFLFCDMPEGYDAKEIMAKAVERGVAFVPGSTTMIDDKAVCSSFRMNYSTASKAEIEKGIKILGDLLKEEVGE
ncbi:MAG TPA: PLP-dependent aminotransferase family protein [Candidatus Monoglobus merdigallinarum]|uniref:PLP-dependent aminotransferase family protein n=1 Tax=Candidatus Monoglobus merdigallinarum TaxID=2838698 RepID=A0A9D1TLN6_9FIRM|nr:PLP-dependent aminotransferase family protein [Candidatus Monoglobus merdigallinarum]